MEKYQLEISYQTIFKIFFVMLAIIFVYYVQQVIWALFAAYVLSTVTNPMADSAEKKNIPRVASAPLIFIGVLAFVAIVFYGVVPSLVGELSFLLKGFPQYIAENTAKYPFLVQFNVGQSVDQIAVSILSYINDQAVNILLSTVSVLSNLFYVFLSFAVAFYLTVEKDTVKLYMRKLMNRSQYKNLVPVIDEIEVKMGKWFVGQVILSLVSGVAIFIGLSLLGVPFAFSLAILASILRFIPYLGGLISDTTGILIAFLSSPVLGILTFFMYYAIQQLEAYILIPYVMKKSVGLNPIVVIVAVVAGGQISGIIGALFAIPITIILVILVKEFVLKENGHLAVK